MTATERLEQWCRKHYRYSIQAGGFMQPGDGHCVTLMAGGRKVQVGEYDLVKPENPDDEDSDLAYPTLDQIINHALDKWDEDQTPKNFRVFFRADYLTFDTAQHWHDKTWMWKVVATSEQEARKKLHDLYPPHENQPEVIQVWEMTANWTH